ncbi:tetratricopeptide repeat protein [bacterium]|nr:tetratricopeptide repeat protein [bacterium]MBR6462466.1 tetratricopeptide repeat protein [bacterium]
MKKLVLALIIIVCGISFMLVSACRDSASNLKSSLDEAQRAINLGDYGRAQQIYYELKQKFPEEQKVRLGLGYCYLKQNHDEYAGGEFSKVLALSQQTNGLAWLGLGAYYQRLRKAEEARICLENAVFCMPDSKEALCDLGNAYFKAGNYEKAADTYIKAVKAGDTRGELYAVIGNCFKRAKNWREAVRYLEKAGSELPKNKKIPLQLAYIYRENFDDPVKAADSFRKYAELDPQGARALYSTFRLPEKNVEEEEPEKPEGAASVTIVDKPDPPPEEVDPKTKAKSDADTFEHDGRLCRLEGKMKEAIKNYEKALKADPARGYLYGEIGDIYSTEFQDDELLNALRSYQSYASWCQKDAEAFAAATQKVKEIQARYNQAETKLRQMREKEEEEKKLAQKEEEERKQALEKDVEQKLSKVKSYDQLLAEGTIYMNQNKYVEARDVLQKAVAMNEDDYRAYYQLGLNAFTQIRGGGDENINKARCEEAIQYFDVVIEKKSDFPKSYALRGVAYEMLGQNGKAMEDFSYYLELVDENDNSNLTKQVNARYQRLAEAR